jgi:MoxR-like ATPase
VNINAPAAPDAMPAPAAAPPDFLPVEEIARLSAAILERVATVVVGMSRSRRVALASILAGGTCSSRTCPGLGKTLAARSLASALGLDFRRLQCTPDLLPADITGSFVYAPATTEFVFRPGPVFTGLFLADEINRTSPKTQSALLEAMAEGQVTVEGNSFRLPSPFHVLATSNPIEYEGTYALPEAQLDRFMVRLAVGYPERTGETQILLNRVERRHEVASVEPSRRRRHAGRDAGRHRTCLRRARHRQLLRRPRGRDAPAPGDRGRRLAARIAGADAARRARAVIDGRDFVTPDDVKHVRSRCWRTGSR